MGGNIELTLPRDFGGELLVELEEDDSNREHRIVSDFPLQVRESTRSHLFQRDRTLHTATGRIGSGINRVRISTIGSNVEIRRR